MSEIPPSVRVSARIYRLLLLLYPRSFRRDFGAEMMKLFEDIAGNAVDHRGSIGLFLTWYDTLLDTASSASRERFAEAQHAVCRIEQRVLDLRWQTALLISLFIGIVLTPADLASMLVLGIPLFGVYVCTAHSSPLPGSLRTAFISASIAPLILVMGLMTNPLHVAPISETLSGLSPVALFMVVPLTATLLTMCATLIAVWIWNGKSRVHLFNQW